jgi:hypothetical protein
MKASPTHTKPAPLSDDETLTLHERIFLDMTGRAVTGLCAQTEERMDADHGTGIVMR